MNPNPLHSIQHDGSRRCVLASANNLRLGDEVTLRLRADPNTPIERLLLRTCPDGEQLFVEMFPEAHPPGAACRAGEGD